MLAAHRLWFTGHGAVWLLIGGPHFPWVERARLIDNLVKMLITGLAGSRGDGAG